MRCSTPCEVHGVLPVVVVAAAGLESMPLRLHSTTTALDRTFPFSFLPFAAFLVVFFQTRRVKLLRMY